MKSKTSNLTNVLNIETFDINKQKLLNSSPDDKEEYVYEMRVTYPFMNKILADMEKCKASAHRLNEVKCMFIAGGSRYGKTTFGKSFQSVYPHIDTETITLKPVLYLKTPPPAYLGSLKSKILEALGDPFFAKTLRNYESDYRIKSLLEKCKVELIFLDEFQHLVEGNRHKVLIDSSDWFKTLIEECKISVVFAGLPYSENVLIENEQLGNRVKIRHELKPFEFNNKDFRIFLHQLDNQLPFEEISNIAQDDTWQRIYLATGGVIGFVKTLLAESTLLAATQNLPCINNDILYDAYNNMLHYLSPDNPFAPTYNLRKAIKEKIVINK